MKKNVLKSVSMMIVLLSAFMTACSQQAGTGAPAGQNAGSSEPGASAAKSKK